MNTFEYIEQHVRFENPYSHIGFRTMTTKILLDVGRYVCVMKMKDSETVFDNCVLSVTAGRPNDENEIIYCLTLEYPDGQSVDITNHRATYQVKINFNSD